MGYTGKQKREYQLKWLLKRRSDWFENNGPCKCGSWKNLELHHLNQEEKVTHRVWSWCQEKRLKELAKCIILCKNCHNIESAKQAFNPINHGENTNGYARGCRCIKCKEVKLSYMKEYRKIKRLSPSGEGSCL